MPSPSSWQEEGAINDLEWEPGYSAGCELLAVKLIVWLQWEESKISGGLTPCVSSF